MKAEEVPRPLLPWLGRACRQAREERDVIQVKIAAAIEVNQATIARFEDGIAWPRQPEEVLMAYASELEMDVRLLWLHAFVLWLETRAGPGQGEPGADSGGAQTAQDLGRRSPCRPRGRQRDASGVECSPSAVDGWTLCVRCGREPAIRRLASSPSTWQDRVDERHRAGPHRL